MRGKAGVTLLEVLIALAIVGALGAIGLASWRSYLEGADRAQAIVTVRQAFNRAATEAATQGVRHRLVYDASNRAFVIKRLEGTTYTTVYTFDLPRGASAAIADGKYVSFTPPGRMVEDGELPNPFTLNLPGGQTRTVHLSLVGDVRVE